MLLCNELQYVVCDKSYIMDDAEDHVPYDTCENKMVVIAKFEVEKLQHVVFICLI